MILIPALPAFHARYPDIQLDMGVSDRRVDLIGENVDCVVRGGELTDQSLIARRVGDLSLGVYAAPSYLARAGVPGHPSELENSHHRVVGFLWGRTGKPTPYVMQRQHERIRVHGRYVLAVDDGNACLAAGLAGLGVLWLPHYMVKTHLANGELVPLLEDWHLDAMPLYLAFPPNRHVSAKLRVFIDWVVELMAQHAPRARPSRDGRGLKLQRQPDQHGAFHQLQQRTGGIARGATEAVEHGATRQQEGHAGQRQGQQAGGAEQQAPDNDQCQHHQGPAARQVRRQCLAEAIRAHIRGAEKQSQQRRAPEQGRQDQRGGLLRLQHHQQGAELEQQHYHQHHHGATGRCAGPS